MLPKAGLMSAAEFLLEGSVLPKGLIPNQPNLFTTTQRMKHYAKVGERTQSRIISKRIYKKHASFSVSGGSDKIDYYISGKLLSSQRNN